LIQKERKCEVLHTLAAQTLGKFKSRLTAVDAATEAGEDEK